MPYTKRNNSGLGSFPPAGTVQVCSNTGTTQIWGGHSWHVPTPTLTPEEIERQEEAMLAKELRKAEQAEKLAALKTIFPRGYEHFDDFDIMVEIARDDQLNPLYDQVLRDFEAAQQALHSAARKLVTAVKLTDMDKLQEIKEENSLSLMGNYFFKGNLNVNSNAAVAASTIQTTLSGTVAAGPMGPAGMPGPMGPMGPKGDKGDPGVVSEQSLIEAVRKYFNLDK